MDGALRLIGVDPTIREPQGDFHRLYSAYQESWKQFRAEAAAWQSLLSEAADEAAINEAQSRVELAQASYRDQRNKFADYLIAKSVNPRVCNALLSCAHLADNNSITQKSIGAALS